MEKRTEYIGKKKLWTVEMGQEETRKRREKGRKVRKEKREEND